MVSGVVPVKKIHEDDLVVGILDIHPQAPIHALFFPKSHIPSLSALEHDDREVIANMVEAATKYARARNIDDSGYRLVMNCNRDGGQTVFHLHCHLLGGRTMTWPPG